MRALDGLLNAQRPPQQILIEASGVADPRSIADIAVLHPGLRRDLVLVLAAAESIRERAADETTCDTVQRQLDAADLVLLNKIDLVADEERASLRQWLGEYHSVPVIETENSQLPLAVLISESHTHSGHSGTMTLASAAHNHDEFTTVTLAIEQPLELEALRQRLTTLPQSILRIKGFVRATEPGNPYYLLQRSGRQIELRQWASDDAEVISALVFIGTRAMPGAVELNRHLGTLN